MSRNATRTLVRDVAEMGVENFSPAQISVGASAVQLLAARDFRRGAVITNTSATLTVYVGATSGVTTATGHPLLPQNSMSVPYTGTLYGIVASSTATVGVSEVYD